MVHDHPVLAADRPDFVPALPGAELRDPCGVLLGVCVGPCCRGQMRREQCERRLSVLVLGPPAITADLQPRRPVRELHAAVGLVPVLSAGAGAPRHRPLEGVRMGRVRRCSLRDREDGNSDGGGMDAAPLLGWGNALPAVPTGFASEDGRRARARDFGR